jgi:hypothetical protein
MEESGRSRVVLRHQGAEDVEEVSKKRREITWESKGVVDSLKDCVCVCVCVCVCIYIYMVKVKLSLCSTN